MRRISSPSALAAGIRSTPDRLKSLAEGIEGRYKQFDVRFPGKSKARHLDNPDGELKEVQKKLKQFLTARIALPDGMYGGVAGGSPKKNAERHIGAMYVATIDIRDCFPSISNTMVFKALRVHAGLDPRVAGLVTKLTTVGNHLPQGAPTSTVLANMVLISLHEDLDKLAEALGLEMSQYIDDITFSGVRAAEAIDPALRLLKSHGFGFSSRKVTVRSRGQRQRVTGIVVNKKTSASRTLVNRLFAEVEAMAARRSVEESALRTLWGRIRYVRGISSCQGDNLMRLALRILPRPNYSQKVEKKRTSDWQPCGCPLKFH